MKKRDEKRIDIILDKFKQIWKKEPDLRFGQLYLNLISGEQIENLEVRAFYMEDDTFEELLDLELKDNTIIQKQISFI